ncbi:MAG: redoxin domain-containing protein [Verrucomicrobiales bacterium]|nr:redoxin domain-containing protein [Verrucomicrobiota bacterium JB025]
MITRAPAHLPRKTPILTAIGSLWALGFAALSADSLQDKLDARRDSFLARAPQETIASQQSALRELEDSGIYDRVLKVGDKAPDITLANAAGKTVQLAELLKKGPVVLTWYRGAWCPYCNLTLAELAAKTPRFEELGATLVALTPEKPDITAATVKDSKLPFEVLSDIGHQVADRYGLVFRLNDETRKRYDERFEISRRNGTQAADRLPLPATYVIDPTGVIRYAFIDADYRRRAEPDRIVDALVALRDGPDARHLLLQFWENTWSPPYDLGLIDRHFAEDFILTSAGRDIAGRPAFREWVRQSLAASRGLRMKNLECFENADGTRVVSRWSVRADGGAVPDSHSAHDQPFQFTGIALWAFEDSKFTHNWVERSAARPLAESGQSE